MSLGEEILSCRKCLLHKTCNRPVPFRNEGYVPGGVMVVGEAPGAREDEVGRPFVGPSGRLLDVWLGILEVSSPWVTNTVHCWPHGAPPSEAVRSCEDWLRREIGEAKPGVILAVGSVARERLSSMKDIPPVVSVKHPAYFLRKGGKGWMDEIQRAKVELDSLRPAPKSI